MMYYVLDLMQPRRFLWGLLPNIPAKTATSADPADIIIRWE